MCCEDVGGITGVLAEKKEEEGHRRRRFSGQGGLESDSIG